jgi:hypothetical protein
MDTPYASSCSAETVDNTSPSISPRDRLFCMYLLNECESNVFVQYLLINTAFNTAAYFALTILHLIAQDTDAGQVDLKI